VFEGCAEDESLITMLGEGLATLGLFMHKRLHADGDEWVGVVVVGTVDVRVCREVGMDIGLLEEEKLAFGLRDGLTPEVERESIGGAAKDTDEVVLPCLEGFLGYVSAVVVGGNQLVGHAGLLDLEFVCCRDLVVEDLMGGDDASEDLPCPI